MRAPRGRQLVLGNVSGDQLRHGGEIEFVGVKSPDRGAQRLGSLARFRVRMGSTKDVGEFSLQAVEMAVEQRRLLRLDVPPGVDHEARGQALVAIDQGTVDPERLPGERKDLGHALVGIGSELRGCLGPEFGQGSARAFGKPRAELALEPENVLAEPFALDAARRQRLEDVVHQDRERGRKAVRRAAVDQHQRKVVAKPREIPVPGELRRAHRDRVERHEALAGPPARHVEDLLVLEFGRHVHRFSPLLSLSRPVTRRRGSGSRRPARR